MGGLFREAFAESAGSAGRRPGGLFTEAFTESAGSARRRPGGLCRETFAESALLGGGRPDFSGKRSLSLLGLLRLDLSGSVESAGRGPGSSSSSLPVAVYQQ